MFLNDLKQLVKEIFEKTRNELWYSEVCYQNLLAHHIGRKFPEFQVSTELTVGYKDWTGYVFGYGRVDIFLESDIF